MKISLFASETAIPEGAFRVFHSSYATFSLFIMGELFLPNGELLTEKNFEASLRPTFADTFRKLLDNCEGSFIIALHDKEKNEFHLATDPFGNLAVYYWNDGDSIHFSSRSRTIADELGQVEHNESGIFEYLTFGQTLSGKTLYKNITRLGAAEHLQFNSSGISIGRYFTPSFESRSRSECPAILNSIKEHLLFNIDIRTRDENVRSGLSGGFDSRVTLAALTHLGRKNVELFTLGLPESNDVKIAKRLAQQTGFRHQVFSYDEKFISSLPEYFEETVKNSGGGMGIEASPLFAVWKQLEDRGIRHLDSHGGPIYRRQILKARMHERKNYPSLASFIFAKMHSPLIGSGVLRDDIEAEAKKQTLVALEEYFSSLPVHLTDGDKIDRFYIEQMCAHHYSLAGNIEMQFRKLSHPLLSARMWELLSQLDGKFRATNAVNRYLIHSLCPELEKIPLDNSGFKVPYSGYNYLRYIPHGIERYGFKHIAKLSPELGKQLSLQRSPFTSEMVIASAPERIREIALSHSPRSDLYFDTQAIEKLDVFDPAIVAVVNAKLVLKNAD